MSACTVLYTQAPRSQASTRPVHLESQAAYVMFSVELFTYPDLILSLETRLGKSCPSVVSQSSLIFSRGERLSLKSLSFPMHRFPFHHIWGAEDLSRLLRHVF